TMKKIPAFVYFFPGLLFGVILLRAEVVSWYRIQEMFHFQSFHMYGVIGSAVAVGAGSLWILRRMKVRSMEGEAIATQPATLRWKANVGGGFLFGLGWAVTGACPGPIYALMGHGLLPYVVIFVSAAVGAVVYQVTSKS
ncbi:MAG TPA: YeeE/YedE thiosulfate transporter family protein, partial [Saprospiraceae bacterium]|nr:YeeE/YedE thiosulfate transporter family protein [Saprospiraceae bacterium]